VIIVLRSKFILRSLLRRQQTTRKNFGHQKTPTRWLEVREGKQKREEEG
jgi:hypothetical protein